MDNYIIDKILDFVKPQENIYKSLVNKMLEYINDYGCCIADDVLDIILSSENPSKSLDEFHVLIDKHLRFFDWNKLIRRGDDKLFKHIFENYRDIIDEEYLSTKKLNKYNWFLLMKDIHEYKLN